MSVFTYPGGRRLLGRPFHVWNYLFLVCLLCRFSAGVALGQQTVRLAGRVRTDTGDTINSGVKIRLETDEGELVVEVPASSTGTFQFDNLRKLDYRLIVTADGFEAHQEDVDLREGAGVEFRDVTLRPARKVLETPGGAQARTDTLASKNARLEFEKGTNDLTAKNLAGAKTHFENAVKEYPCYARAQTDLGTVLEAQRDLAGAEAALKKARECDPDYIDSYIILGQLLNNQKRFADGEQVLQEGLRRSPASWQFYYQLAVAHSGLMQYSKAEGEYNKVLELKPAPPPEFRVKLADVYLKEKKYGPAYSQMEEYLKADPDGRFASKVKSIMQQMKSAGVLQQPEEAER